MTVKISIYNKVNYFPDQLNDYRTYNPVLLNFYHYIGINFDFTPDNAILAMELAKWCGTYTDKKDYILFERDEDATLFLLRFA